MAQSDNGPAALCRPERPIVRADRDLGRSRRHPWCPPTVRGDSTTASQDLFRHRGSGAWRLCATGSDTTAENRYPECTKGPHRVVRALRGGIVRRRPTLPPRLRGSTIGAERLSFRVRNGTGRFPLAMAAGTLLRCESIPDRISGTAQWTRIAAKSKL